MDYEKAYKDALERARKFYNDCVKGDNPIQAQRYVDIFPELNEHPDPRHSLIEFIKWSCDRGCITPEQKKNVDFWLAYLEKQKEQKPLSTEEAELNSIAFLEQMGYTCIPPKEHKPILEVFGFKVGDAVRLKDGDGRKHIIKSFEEVKGIHGPNFYLVEFEDNSARDGIYPGKKYPNGYYTHMEKFEEEQKPVSGSSEKPNYHAEWSEDTLDEFTNNIRALITDKLTTKTKGPDGSEMSFSVFIDDKTAKDIANGILFYVGKEAMKNPNREIPEWSEEDKNNINKLLAICSGAKRYRQFAGCDQECITKLQMWLKSLRPQPKQEDRYLEGYTKGYAEGYKKAEENYNNSVVYRMPIPITQQLDPNVVTPSTTDGTSSPEVECKRK